MELHDQAKAPGNVAVIDRSVLSRIRVLPRPAHARQIRCALQGHLVPLSRHVRLRISFCCKNVKQRDQFVIALFCISKGRRAYMPRAPSVHDVVTATGALTCAGDFAAGANSVAITEAIDTGEAMGASKLRVVMICLLYPLALCIPTTDRNILRCSTNE